MPTQSPQDDPPAALSTSLNLIGLNRNEGRWMGTIRGPLAGGWFSFAEHGNPPFYVPVEVTDGYLKAIGWRTPEIIPGCGKEKWAVLTSPDMTIPLILWRPRALSRESLWVRVMKAMRIRR